MNHGIHGAHVLLQSTDAKADLAFLAGVLGQPPSVDAGGGWLIYALPPAEIAVHPSDKNDVCSLYLMCTSMKDFLARMAAKDVACSEVHEERWGTLVHVTLPGGGKLGVYEPHHPSPKHAAAPAKRAKKAPAARANKSAAKAKKPAKKPAKKAKKGKRR